jgi:hypothetical protein
MKLFTFALSCFGMSSAFAGVLPSEFSLQNGPQGPTLIWSSETVPIRVGGSRFEFRVVNSTLLGYPREIQGELRLLLSSAQLQTLADQETSLEVWSSGRRIDAAAPENPLRPASSAAASATSTPTPTVPIDPGLKGIYKTLRTSYNVAAINIEDFSVPIEVVGEVTYPKNALGKRPLVFFLHGRHSTCYQGGPTGSASEDWPCPDGWLPVPSHQGFRYITDILASQGYIVVSISANGISAEDYVSADGGASARSILIRHHLSLWAKWNTNGGSPWGNLFKGRVDLNQVVLAGQNRGGEGVHRAAIDASPSDPYKIVGLVTYGATASGHQVTPDVHSVNILPTCDGDVYDLQGQVYVDSSRDVAYSEALRSAVVVVGANQNYFNTEWTPGLAVAPAWDDWWDDYEPVCGSQGPNSVRLTPKEQRKVGVTYTAALIKMAVNQDATMLPLLDGSYVRPSVIGRAEVSTNAVGGAKYRGLYHPEDGSQPVFRNGMMGKKCYGISWSWSQSTSSIYVCGEGNYVSPHWLPISSRLSPQALELQWTDSPGAVAQFRVFAGARDLSSLNSLDVRIINDPFTSSDVRFDLMVVDDRGRNATLLTNLTKIERFPAPLDSSRVQARTLRGSLASVRSKVNLGRIASVILFSRSATGRVWVLDVAASQARIQVPAVLNLPKLSLESAVVLESDGPQQFALQIVSDRPLTSAGSVWVDRPYSYYYNFYNLPSGYQLDFVPSKSTVVGEIMIDHVGDDIFSFDVTHDFFLEAIKGVVTGDFQGSLKIENDDPAPILSVTATDVTALEGQSLKWTFELSAPTAGLFFSVSIIPPPNGATELTSGDVPTSWLSSLYIDPPITSVPLSELGLNIYLGFDYESQTAQISIPVSRDGQAEGDEVVVLELYNDIDPENFETITLTGKVLAHS